MTLKNPAQGQSSRKHRDKPGFTRRYYSGLKPIWKDFGYLLSRRDRIREAMHSDDLSFDFRERLMLAVTEVNQCRYCRAFHVQQAAQAGLTGSEIRNYLEGLIPDEVPEDQKLAVAYARHWAESDGEPDPAVVKQLRDVYGESLSQAIDLSLRMIRMGNLLGNTADYLLFRLSCGRWGVG